MNELSVSEKIFLALYFKVLGKKYEANDSKTEDGIMITHLLGNKVMFPFTQYHVPGVDYYFEWDKRGPHSEELKQMMKRLDNEDKKSAIESFYKNDNSMDIFSDFQKNRIVFFCETIKELVDFKKYKEKGVIHNMEMFSSMLFLSHTDMSGYGFEDVYKKLIELKKWKEERDLACRVWDILNSLQLVPLR